MLRYKKIMMRVLLVDDDSFTRTMLRASLATISFEVVAAEGTAAEGLRAARQFQPDVVLLDLDLGEGPTGIDLSYALRKALPGVGIVMLSTYEEPRLMGINLPQLPTGAIFLTKKNLVDPEVLRRALLRSVLSERLSTQVLAGASEPTARTADLTDLQIELMRLVALGYSNAEISRRRGVTGPAIEKAVARLIKQLDLRATPEMNQRVVIAQLYFQFAGTVSARRA
jgi:DNA-binding NarL/FixJ family response regulator